MAIELIYGDSHSGKSTALEVLARQMHKQTGKRTRVYIGDGGGESYNSHGLVDDGIIELFDYSGRDFPMMVLKQMADYWWPQDTKDPSSKLVAPVMAKLAEVYGLVIFEGGQVMGQWLLSDVPGGFAWHSANETGFGGVKDEDDLLHYEDQRADIKDIPEVYRLQGVVSPKQFYKVQQKLLSAVRASKKFPGLVYWTSHPTQETADKTAGATSDQYGKITGKKIIGPDFGGKALASLITKDFGNSLHADSVPVQTKVKDETTGQQVTNITREYRLYTRRHMDPELKEDAEYIAGNRAYPGAKLKMPDYFVSKEPGDSILQFYQRLSDIRTEVKASSNANQTGAKTV